MKVVILAGGMGTRLAEFTRLIPKPMVKLCKKPIISYIINHYIKYGFKDFLIATGYKRQIIERYFKKKNFGRGVKIRTIFTGLRTMTGGRIKRLETIIGQNKFMVTYGDGLSNSNLKSLLKLHNKEKNIATLTAVRPPARFGAIELKGAKVISFKEKSNLDEGWINGGFFVFEPDIFKYLKNDKTYLEREPLEYISNIKKLGAIKHNGHWQCMDTVRDKQILEKMIKKKYFS